MPWAHRLRETVGFRSANRGASNDPHVAEASVVAVGAAVGIAGGVLMGVAAGQAADANDRQDPSAYDSARTLWSAGRVGAVAAGLAAAGGVVVLVLSSAPSSRSAHGGGPAARTEPAPRPMWLSANGAGVVLGGAW